MEIVVIDPGYDSYEYEKRLFEENGFEFKVFEKIPRTRNFFYAQVKSFKIHARSIPFAP